MSAAFFSPIWMWYLSVPRSTNMFWHVYVFFGMDMSVCSCYLGVRGYGCPCVSVCMCACTNTCVSASVFGYVCGTVQLNPFCGSQSVSI